MADALARARGEIARHNDRADQHARYSRLLSKAGLGEAARAEARRATELDPRSAAAFANLARALTYDLLGTQFRPGMDWAGAAAAYQKALELDPSDVATRMDWAILLEHDEDGLRYAPGTRMDDAIDEYRKAQRQLGFRNRLDALEINLATDLLYRERFAELEKLAGRAGKSAAWRAFLVAAVAAGPQQGEQPIHGVAEADRLASALAPAGEGRREILEDAAEFLQRARLYAPAAVLYEAAAKGSDHRRQLRDKAKAVAQLRRADTDADLAGEAPRRVVQQLFKAGLCGGKEAEKIPALLTAGAVPTAVAAAPRPSSAPSLPCWTPPAKSRFRRCESRTA